MTFIINAYGHSGKQYALEMECESFEQVEEACKDMGLMLRWFDIGEKVNFITTEEC